MHSTGVCTKLFLHCWYHSQQCMLNYCNCCASLCVCNCTWHCCYSVGISPNSVKWNLYALNRCVSKIHLTLLGSVPTVKEKLFTHFCSLHECVWHCCGSVGISPSSVKWNHNALNRCATKTLLTLLGSVPTMCDKLLQHLCTLHGCVWHCCDCVGISSKSVKRNLHSFNLNVLGIVGISLNTIW